MLKSKSSIVFEVTIVIENDDGDYYAYCPSLKGLHTCGTTIQEALENAKQAVVAYLSSLMKHNEPIPLNFVVIERKSKTAPKPKANLFRERVTIPA